MKTISIINQKGGVGKSTTAHLLAKGLVLKGYKVLCIDLDPQCNLTYTLNVSCTPNILELLINPNNSKEKLQRSNDVDVIASTPLLSNIDSILTQTGKEYKLKEALEQLQNDFDYCVIDTPPTLNILMINALTCSDFALIPAQADVYSLQGIGQLNSTIQSVKKYCNSNLKIIGVLLTRFNKRAIVRKGLAQVIENTAKELNTKLFKTRIRECTAIVEAQLNKQDIFTYAPTSNAANDYKELIEEVLKEVN